MTQAWRSFCRELDRAYLPVGRASHGVRRDACTIVRLMVRDGAGADEIRAALTRAIMQHHCALERHVGARAIPFRDALLADVLQHALRYATQYAPADTDRTQAVNIQV